MIRAIARSFPSRTMSDNIGYSMSKHVHLFSDTSCDAEAVMLDIYRRMPAWRKIELIEDACRTNRLLAMVGLRSRFPGESLPKLRRRLLGLVLGEDEATRIYGPVENLR
jgi:hypothetical protein